MKVNLGVMFGAVRAHANFAVPMNQKRLVCELLSAQVVYVSPQGLSLRYS